jgi:hypothetical protein
MCWSGFLTFLILLIMEGVIVAYRMILGHTEPEFDPIFDQHIIIAHEVAEEYGGTPEVKGTKVARDSHVFKETTAENSSKAENESPPQAAVMEMDADEHAEDGIVSLASRVSTTVSH